MDIQYYPPMKDRLPAPNLTDLAERFTRQSPMAETFLVNDVAAASSHAGDGFPMVIVDAGSLCFCRVAILAR